MRRLFIAIVVTLIASLPMSAEQKNVKVLTGLTDYQLIRTMWLMRASLGVTCEFCHATAADGKDLDFASDAKKEKATARKMITMVQSINAHDFEGRPQVSCNTCHRAAVDPVGILPLPQPPPPAPKPASAEKPARPTLPTRDELVAKYAAAIGKPARSLWESRHLVGLREGSDGVLLPITIDEGSGMAHAIVKVGETTMEQAGTATSGWTRNAEGVHALGATEQAIFNMLVHAYGPLLPESIPADARVVRRISEGRRDFYLVVFKTEPGTRERLELDASSGLLLRRVTLIDTPVGVTPLQMDFDDWRDVGGGVKYPFLVKVSPVDPRLGSTRRYNEVKLGAALDPKAMEMPK